MSNDYDIDLTVNDALALLLDLSLDRVRQDGSPWLLEEYRNSVSVAAGTLEDAKEQDIDEKTIEKLEADATIASNRHDQAVHYYTLLVGEITKIRQGLPSKLLLVEDTADSPMDYSNTVISRASFLEWSRGLPAWDSDDAQPKDASNQPSPKDGKFTNLDKEKHQVTIAFLLELIQKKQGPAYSNKDGGPNLAMIAADIRDLHPNIDPKGYSAETLADRFSASMKTKRELIK